jgi:hypothetical protein
MGDAKGWIMPLIVVAAIAFAIGFGVGVESAPGRPVEAVTTGPTAESPWHSIPWGYGGGGGGLATRQ